MALAERAPGCEPDALSSEAKGASAFRSGGRMEAPARRTGGVILAQTLKFFSL